MSSPFYRPDQQPVAFVFMWDAIQIARRLAKSSGRSLFVNIHVHGWLIEDAAYREFGDPLVVRPSGEVIDHLPRTREAHLKRRAA